MTETTGDVRRIIEKAVWRHGVTGESCALITATILEDLHEAGWSIVPIED